MTEIEKIIELCKTACSPDNCEKRGRKTCYECVANHFFANGVRLESEQATSDKASKVVEIDQFNKWIPVTERFPENDTAVIVATDNGIVFQCLYAYDGWDLWDGYTVNITHWMPLPEPPKEVDNA